MVISRFGEIMSEVQSKTQRTGIQHKMNIRRYGATNNRRAVEGCIVLMLMAIGFGIVAAVCVAMVGAGG
jgi:hypothetical protein